MVQRATRFPPWRLIESVDTWSAFETITDAVDRLAQAKLIPLAVSLAVLACVFGGGLVGLLLRSRMPAVHLLA